MPVTVPLLGWNEGEHVDRVRVDYRNPNDAGVSPPRGPALVLASSTTAAVVGRVVVATVDDEQRVFLKPGARDTAG